MATSLWTDLFRRGLGAMAPTSPGFQGGTFGFYYAEDTEKLYFWDGDAWVEVPLTAGGGGAETNYPKVTTWADLPASTASGDIYIVLTTTGIPLVNRKPAGLWHDAASGWTYLGNGITGSDVVFTPAGSIAATNVQAAIEELASDASALPALAFGTYTPSLTNVTNLDASTAYECQYLRVGNTVTVSGRVDIDPSSTTTATELGITLPVASNFAVSYQCAGSAFAFGVAGQGAAILGDVTNDRACMKWVSSDITNMGMFFSFTYRII